MKQQVWSFFWTFFYEEPCVGAYFWKFGETPFSFVPKHFEEKWTIKI